MAVPKGHPYGENIRWYESGHPWSEWLDQQDARRAATAAQAEDAEADGSEWVMLHVDGSSGDAALERAVGQRMLALFQLFKDRQRKYGPGNIAAFGDLGVCVRAQDKLARLRHHYFAGGAGDMPDESVDDAWSDLAVYAVIALVCRHGGWPGWEARK